MGQVLHGSATTTAAVRRAIQHSQESLRTLATRYGINPKTVAKWKKRGSVDRPADGPERSRRPPSSRSRRRPSSSPSAGIRFLPLDDCLYALQPDDPASDAVIPAPLSATPRHLAGLPDVDGDKPARSKFKSYPIGFFHIDIAEVRTGEGKLICSSPSTGPPSSPSSSCTRRPRRPISREFLLAPDRGRPLQDPHRAHRQRHPVHDARRRRIGRAADPGGDGQWRLFRAHAFEYACAGNDIDHRTPSPNIPGPTARSSA